MSRTRKGPCLPNARVLRTSVTYIFFNFTPNNYVRCEPVLVGHNSIFLLDFVQRSVRILQERKEASTKKLYILRMEGAFLVK